jgi:hypothetical protein
MVVTASDTYKPPAFSLERLLTFDAESEDLEDGGDVEDDGPAVELQSSASQAELSRATVALVAPAAACGGRFGNDPQRGRDAAA